jgi:hypothetical protein
MSTRKTPGGKDVQKFWSLNLLESHGTLQACSGKALPLLLYLLKYNTLIRDGYGDEVEATLLMNYVIVCVGKQIQGKSGDNGVTTTQ